MKAGTFYVFVPKGGSELRVATVIVDMAQPRSTEIVLASEFETSKDAWDWVRHQRAMIAVERAHCVTCED